MTLHIQALLLCTTKWLESDLQLRFSAYGEFPESDGGKRKLTDWGKTHFPKDSWKFEPWINSHWFCKDWQCKICRRLEVDCTASGKLGGGGDRGQQLKKDWAKGRERPYNIKCYKSTCVFLQVLAYNIYWIVYLVVILCHKKCLWYCNTHHVMPYTFRSYVTISLYRPRCITVKKKLKTNVIFK